MYHLYEVRDWIYECERFLFLAEVHFVDENVSPLCHKFCHVLTGSKLEEMLDLLSEQNCSCLNVHSCITTKELDLFKCIVDSVSFERWNELSTEVIIEAQRILHNIARGLRNDIERMYKERGYPLLCSDAELYL
ncbi:hypothetical protein [uncultured Methanomethylovorans sp.]|uniref:hypothetical protein n=1 Tax=uncultured Methanomethylovorans sp. TaxID=183759 RepID=UPI002AA7AD53|nr:hypothetical protein [uncultured Methanomethylovorans sp.]